MSERVPLPLRQQRLNMLAELAADRWAEFPAAIDFPGDADHARRHVVFPDRATLDRTIREAEINAIVDGLVIYRLRAIATKADGTMFSYQSCLLAPRAAADPWREANIPRKRSWLSVPRGWMRKAG